MLKSVTAAVLLTLTSLASTAFPAQSRTIILQTDARFVLDTERLIAHFSNRRQGSGGFFVIEIVGIKKYNWSCDNSFNAEQAAAHTSELARIFKEEPVFDPTAFLKERGLNCVGR